MTSGIAQFAVIQSVAPSIGIEVSPINLRDVQEIERAVATFTARVASGGLVVTASPLSLFHR
jgi:putative ABC transport system substrate-binding protein